MQDYRGVDGMLVSRDEKRFKEKINQTIEEKIDSLIETMKANHEREIAQLHSEINELKSEVKELKSEINELKLERSDPKTEDRFLDQMLLNNADKDGKRERMNFALEMEANVETADDKGFTPLFYSILNGDHDTARRLLNKKASLESRDKEGKTILHIMSEKGDIRAVQFIVDHLPKDDKEAKILLSVHDSLNNLEAVEEKKDIKQLISNAILFQAAKQGNVDLAKKAIERGAEIDAQDENLETALHKACYSGEIKMVTFLLKNNCCITKKDTNHQLAADTTAKTEIKELILNYQIKKENTITIQKYICGFSVWQKYEEPLKEMKELNKKIEESKPQIQKWNAEGNIISIAKLTSEIMQQRSQIIDKAASQKRSSDSRQIIDEEMQAVADQGRSFKI